MRKILLRIRSFLVLVGVNLIVPALKGIWMGIIWFFNHLPWMFGILRRILRTSLNMTLDVFKFFLKMIEEFGKHPKAFKSISIVIACAIAFFVIDRLTYGMNEYWRALFLILPIFGAIGFVNMFLYGK